MKTAAPVILALRPRAAGATLLRWLYDDIRLAIVEGRLAPGARLPSTRNIARQYRIARGTVVAAFDHLVAEGYIRGDVGSGSFVRPMTALSSSPDGATTRARPRPNAVAPSLSARGRRLASHPFSLPWADQDPEALTFLPDLAALEAFPIRTWSRITARCLRRAESDHRLLHHGSTCGLPALREAIAAQSSFTRGVKCTADQVVITTGTQQSLDLVARLVLDEGDRAWMEDPGYPAITRLLRALAEAVRRKIPDVVELAPACSGLQIVGWLPAGMDDVAACKAAFAQRIYCAPLSRFTIDRTLRPAMVLFPAATDVRAITRAVAALGSILRGLQGGVAAATA